MVLQNLGSEGDGKDIALALSMRLGEVLAVWPTTIPVVRVGPPLVPKALVVCSSHFRTGCCTHTVSRFTLRRPSVYCPVLGCMWDIHAASASRARAKLFWSVRFQCLRFPWHSETQSTFTARDIFVLKDIGTYKGQMSLYVHTSSCRSRAGELNGIFLQHLPSTCFFKFC